MKKSQHPDRKGGVTPPSLTINICENFGLFSPWNILKEHLISGVDKLIAVSTRLSSQARLAGSARPNSTPLPALATPREEGST